MKTLQDFSPYNALYWEPNGSRSKIIFDMDLLDDMGLSKLSAKVFFKSELLL